MPTGISDLDRSGADHPLALGQIRSSRYHRISAGIYRLHGGWVYPDRAGAARHTRKCPWWRIHSHRWIPLSHWMLVLCVLALCHQSYRCCTIITHMRINHINHCELTVNERLSLVLSGEGYSSGYQTVPHDPHRQSDNSNDP